MRHVWRNEEGLTLAHEMINDAIAFPDPHFDVPLELVEKFFRVDLMKIVPGVRTFDDHDEKVAAVIDIAVADGRFEEVAILFDPAPQIQWLLHSRRFGWLRR